MGEGFYRPVRQKTAGILDVFQDFLTRQGSERPAQTAFNACEYRFLQIEMRFDPPCRVLRRKVRIVNPDIVLKRDLAVITLHTVLGVIGKEPPV